MTPTQKKLWLATVEHEAVPGVKIKLIFQEDEPTDEEILGHFADEIETGDNPLECLVVTGCLDVTWDLQFRGNKEPFMAAAEALKTSQEVSPETKNKTTKPWRR